MLRRYLITDTREVLTTKTVISRGFCSMEHSSCLHLALSECHNITCTWHESAWVQLIHTAYDGRDPDIIQRQNIQRIMRKNWIIEDRPIITISRTLPIIEIDPIPTERNVDINQREYMERTMEKNTIIGVSILKDLYISAITYWRRAIDPIPKKKDPDIIQREYMKRMMQKNSIITDLLFSDLCVSPSNHFRRQIDPIPTRIPTFSVCEVCHFKMDNDVEKVSLQIARERNSQRQMREDTGIEIHDKPRMGNQETVKEENFHGDEELRETGGETSTSDINENDSCTITEKLCQLLHFIKTTIMPLKKTECGHLASMIHFVILLSSLLVSSCTSNVVECPKVQYIRLTARAVVKCTELVDFPFIYWYNNIDKDASALIQKVNGEVAGKGYTTGEFNIDNEGSLVINDVKIHDERTFRVKALDSTLSASIYDITLIVYVEPGEPLPVIPECSEQSTCIHKVDSHRVISCIHGESRPAMEVSWFLRDGREDRLLNASVNQIESADAVTVTTSATLAVDEIPVDANVALVLVCKTIQPIPNANGSERVILLDFSVDVPFTDEEYLAPVYAFEREEDFKIKCLSGIDTTSNVVLWMFKSLNSENFEYILYSAFGEMAFTTEDNDGFNLTDSGALVIKKVDLQHEGYYACVSSLENTMESSVQNLEVIVLPKPPRIVVQGCEPFQPCHLSAREAETITCTVNGVRPQVDLSIVTYSTNVAVTKTTVSSYKEDGLFYTTVEGHVDVSKVTCEENHVTVICQARGTAAYGFMSDVFVTIPVDGKDCIESMTATFVQEGEGCRNHLQVWTFVITVLFLLVHSACALFLSRKIQVLKKFQHTMESQPLQSGTINGNPPLYITTTMSTSEEETSGASQKENHI